MQELVDLLRAENLKDKKFQIQTKQAEVIGKLQMIIDILENRLPDEDAQREIEKIKELQGNYDKRLMPAEVDPGHLTSFRKAIYPAVDLAAGTVLDRENITSLRPNVGIDAKDYLNVIGRKLKVPKRAFEHLAWDDLE